MHTAWLHGELQCWGNVQGGVQRSRVSFGPCAPFALRCKAHGKSVLNGEVLASSVSLK